ncbi:SDR family oxidoreductase [Pacificibacter marinus]|uniref:NAD dependent epimerase/dehydratase family protein n=1 Tax=Pacificibacter marinus TaxID=658057 RepID=A0A1Y5TI61_9RHOB|nr:SDR family oxidoreductase [Pacificibacter marinus]SEL12443.1 Nucleoside-diphosphate-sugar epimerase [Pacificibacter marinus]SLN60882.1 NAD dependent epimerase/dehydratase family protein [Pacificibacter marinus]
MPDHLFSYGHGYSAQALAALLLPLNWDITGTTRRLDKALTLRKTGMTCRVLPDETIHDDLLKATHFLTSAAPTDAGDPFLAQHLESLKDAAKNLKWVGYLSTTGVYGNHDGDWVDETTPLTPATKRGKARVEAEAHWIAVAKDLGLNLKIFRLAGIYGPGRGPFAKVRNGTARRIIKQNQIFSRTHVEDIAQVLLASIHRPDSSQIFNVCDDMPAPPEDVIGHAAELLGLPIPATEDFETAQMTPMARSFYAESKKVRNDRIKDALGVSLIYPDYHSGLKALLAAES